MRRAHPSLAGLLLLTACADLPLPSFLSSDVPSQFEEASSQGGPIWPPADWWRTFGDPQLTALIAKAQAGNLDLYQAAARVRQADARARQAGAVLVPTVGFNANGISYYGRAKGQSLGETDYSVTPDVSYDLDFWGKNRDALNSANAAREATSADRATVALAVTAGVANSYFQLLALRERIEVAKDDLASSQAILNIVERRVKAGYAANADLTQARANLAAQRALSPALEQQELETRTALAILLGRPSEGFDIAPARLAAISVPPVRPGLPSELLTRRPDVASAEANLAAAHADLSVARKAYLPDISLTANAGVAYPAVNAAINALSGTGFSTQAGATVLQAVFDGGKIEGKIEESKAREEELLGAYRAAVIASFSDVENALGRVAHLSAQQTALETQVAQSGKVLQSARRKYTAGYADFLVVTDAERTLYVARDQLIDIRRARLAALVTLYKALGGGWTSSPVSTADRNSDNAGGAAPR